MIKIQPVVFPIKGTATNLDLKVNGFSMDAKTADFHYRLTSDGDLHLLKAGKVIDEGNLTMTKEEFAQWGADNQYCIEWACKKLGLTLIKDSNG
jgi:hypothetical protein